jgi:hypothetical protein
MSLRPTTGSGNGGIHWGKRYDALITLFTLGREGAPRDRGACSRPVAC